MKQKVKVFVQSVELKVAVAAPVVCAAVMGGASAVEDTTGGGSSTEIISAFSAGFQQIKADAFAVIAVAVPIAVSIAAVLFISKKAMSWFKGMAK